MTEATAPAQPLLYDKLTCAQLEERRAKLIPFDLPSYTECIRLRANGKATELSELLYWWMPNDKFREHLSAALSEVIADRELEIARLQALVDGRFKDAAKLYLMSAGPTQDGFQFDIRGEVIGLIAEHLAATFKEMGGENYVAMELNHDELGPLVLTMQRQLGKMPHTVAAEAKAEIVVKDEENARLRTAHEAILSKDMVSWLDARILSARALGIEGHPATLRTGVEIDEYKRQNPGLGPELLTAAANALYEHLGLKDNPMVGSVLCGSDALHVFIWERWSGDQLSEWMGVPVEWKVGGGMPVAGADCRATS